MIRHPDKDETLEVAFVCDLAAEPGRGILRGVTRYARLKSTWNVTLIAKITNEANPASLVHWQGDGMIAQATSEEVYRQILSKQCPVILFSRNDFEKEDVSLKSGGAETSGVRGRGPNYVSCDNEAVVRMALDYFGLKMYAHFAYVPCSKRVYWCLERQMILERIFAERGEAAAYSIFPTTETTDWSVERDRMEDWLRALPKPAGVLAANDLRGRQVLEACQRARISVPHQVAVLGINNDIPICEMSYPSLSSVAIDWEKAGFMSGEALDRLMYGNAPAERHYGPTEIVTRNSTESLNVPDAIVVRILEMIRQNKGENPRVSEILKSVPISGRRAQERFKLAVGHSIKEEIQRVRMRGICDLIEETDLSFHEIAKSFGFEDATHLGKIFKKEFGMTMGEYRKQKKTEAPPVFYRAK